MKERYPLTNPGPMRSILPIAAVVTVLAIAGVAVALLAAPGEPETYPPDSPEGVVQRYIQALQDRDIERAYGYLSSDIQDDTPEEEYRQRTRLPAASRDGQRVRLDEVEIDGDRATVHLTIERVTGNDLDFSRYSYQRVVPLVREDGQWKIDDLVLNVAGSVPAERTG